MFYRVIAGRSPHCHSDDVMHKQQVEISTPCGIQWNRLTRKGNARLCRQCDKLVHDLSALTEARARALLESESGGLCVRYLYDATGAIRFDQAPLVKPGGINLALRQAVPGLYRSRRSA